MQHVKKPKRARAGRKLAAAAFLVALLCVAVVAFIFGLGGSDDVGIGEDIDRYDAGVQTIARDRADGSAAPSMGEIEVISRPLGAELWRGDEYIGKTPVTLSQAKRRNALRTAA